MTIEKPILTSRSRLAAYGECPRRGWLNFDWGGTGLVGKLADLDLVVGIAVHKGLEEMMKSLMEEKPVILHSAGMAGVTEFSKLTAAHQQAAELQPHLLFRLEELSLLSYALIYGWGIARLESFKTCFDVVQVEQELKTPIGDDVILQSRLDVGVRNRFDNNFAVINWKTSGKKEPRLLTVSFQHQPQMWLEPLAFAHYLGDGPTVIGTICEILYKGTVRDQQSSSNLLYGYQTDSGISPIYKPGKKKVRIDEVSGDTDPYRALSYWINKLPSSILDTIFFPLEPIDVPAAQKEDRLASIRYRERATFEILEYGYEADKLQYFFARDGSWCAKCPYRGFCKEGTPIEDLVESGELIPRVDHHAEVSDEE